MLSHDARSTRQGLCRFPRESTPMQPYSTRAPAPTKILTRREFAAVLTELQRKSPRSRNTRLNLIIFRLAACCGLRASEIAQLRIADVRLNLSRPHLRIRRGAAKGGRARMVPLWWDSGTFSDLAAWKGERMQQVATEDEPFLASYLPARAKMHFSRHTLRKRFRTACKTLGEGRLVSLTIHHGRHTFISHALAGGRTLAEVRDAAGHANVSITSAYLHIAIDNEVMGDLFRFA
ncbi:MAG: tyrosine-type recombinase/integrase [Pirellulaceae bacterium]